MKKIVFAGLITCPWYLYTQSDRGLQAKHNTLLVLYMHTETQFFSPVNYHLREQSEVIDQVCCCSIQQTILLFLKPGSIWNVQSTCFVGCYLHGRQVLILVPFRAGFMRQKFFTLLIIWQRANVDSWRRCLCPRNRFSTRRWSGIC